MPDLYCAYMFFVMSVYIKYGYLCIYSDIFMHLYRIYRDGGAEKILAQRTS